MATLTVGLMDPPYESGSTLTGFRIIDAALRRGHHVNVFLYEGAVCLASADQRPHANPVKGKSVEDLDHPNPKEWVLGLFELAKAKGLALQWINCGLCVDERGADKQVEGVKRGSPGDFWKLAEASDGLLWIATH